MNNFHPSNWSRRQWLETAGGGAGWLALQGMFGSQQAAADASLNPLAAKPAHFPAKAKSIIWIFMNGGPSQVDTWNYRPELEKRDGQTLADFDTKTGFFPDSVGGLMKSPFAWKQHGQ